MSAIPASIAFDDFEPSLLPAAWKANDAGKVRSLVRHSCSMFEAREVGAGCKRGPRAVQLQIIGLLEGQAKLCGDEVTVDLAPGQFSLVPASLASVVVRAETRVAFLRVEA